MRGKAQRVARPAQTRLQQSAVTGPKFTKFLPDVEGSSTLLTRASMFRSSHPLWNASAQNEGGVCQFSPIRAKNRLPWQHPSSDREKKVVLIMPTHIFTYPENLLKIGPVHSQIIVLKGDRYKEDE